MLAYIKKKLNILDDDNVQVASVSLGDSNASNCQRELAQKSRMSGQSINHNDDTVMEENNEDGAGVDGLEAMAACQVKMEDVGADDPLTVGNASH